ncbi:MAG: S41 family peptidase, partial [SAR324 cluster bacterium]|nr:S41 family peptidase [SAR324 cluster bacterium]
MFDATSKEAKRGALSESQRKESASTISLIISCEKTVEKIGLASTLRKLGYVLFASLLIITLLGRALPDVVAREKNDSSLFDELKLFTDVLAIVQRDYVQQVDPKKLVEGAIKGMLSNLDPHSGYLDPEFYKELQVQTTGEFGGLGIEITIREGMLIVVAPMAGSPAELAGVKPGDLIIKIDDKFTRDLTLVDAVRKLRGPKGTTVTIAVQRQGSKGLLEYTIKRDNIVVESVFKRVLDGDYGYVRLTQFMEKTGDDLKKALKFLKEQTSSGDLKGLILDLRNNPGGLLNQAVSVSDLFLKEGIIVYTDGRIESQKQKYYAHERGTEPDYPIVAIVNGGSASAAEIVAAALKDHGRAVIVGTQTFGKGSVQTVIPLKNGGALTLTTQLYYTKSGESIQLEGVKPDVVVEMPPLKDDEDFAKPI